MKFFHRLCCLSIIIVFVFVLGGCTELYEMTSEEEDQIVMYASRIVSKFNRTQDDGYSNVSDEKKKQYEEIESGVESDEEDDEEVTHTEVPATLDDVFGIEGVELVFNSYEIVDTYSTDLMTFDDAGEDGSYLVLHFTINNNSGANFEPNFSERPIGFQLNIAENKVLESIKSADQSDLSTYYRHPTKNPFPHGTSDEVFLLFKVSKSEADSIDRLILIADREGNTYNINLQ